MIAKIEKPKNTHNFAQKDDIFTAYDENAMRNVAILFPNMNPLNCPVEYEVGELIDAPQIAD